MALTLSNTQWTDIGVLVKLRLCQAKKMVYELGNYAIFLAFALLLIIAFTYYVHRDEAGSQKLFMLLAAIVVVAHQSRKDKIFVLKHIAYPHVEMMLEYLVIVLPFIVFGIYFYRFQSIGLLLLCIAIVPYINVSTKQGRFNAFIRYIPASMFEWKSGVRRVFWPFILLYLVALASSWFMILPLVVLWLLTTVMMGFYDENESLPILHEYESTAAAFLHKKIINHLKFLLLLYMPILVINTIFNPDYIWINALFVLAQLTLLVFAITTKYMTYVPNARLFNNSNFTAIMTLLGALPGFFIIPLFLALFNYRKAINNLIPYFDND
jgi:hypothetical protein